MNNETKILYLFRHGETNLNVDGTVMGQLLNLNTEFTGKGYEQINHISNELKNNKIEIIYTSDFKRTLETAKLADANNNLPIIITKEVRGLNMGKYQGMPFANFITLPEVRQSFYDYNIPFENGESINDLNNRIINFIRKVCNNTKHKKIAIITHSAVISNLKAFVSNEAFVSVNMCSFIYKNNNLEVLDYSLANDKNKIKGKNSYGIL